MKTKEFKSKINNLSFTELSNELKLNKNEYRKIRFDCASGKQKNVRRASQIKKQIAQILTTARIKQIDLAKEKRKSNAPA